jgi:hypothetical protein
MGSARPPWAQGDSKRLGTRVLGSGMQLTAQIKEATDGWLSLTVDEIPTLVVHARNVEEIP